MAAKKQLILIIIPCILIGFGSALILGPKAVRNTDNPCGEKKIYLTNCDLIGKDQIIKKQEYTVTKARITDYINSQKQNGSITTASVYFRDLLSGPTMGVNESEKFAGASLLKLPILLTYLKLEEEKPGFLNKKLVYEAGNSTTAFSQNYTPQEHAQNNTPYSIEELLRFLIVYSDNNASDILKNYLVKISPNKSLLLDTYYNLGLLDPANASDETISVRAYGSIFRNLYNLSYFDTQEMSEKALNLLSQADFKQGIVAGVPSDTLVAHKFGERSSLKDPEKQLHDCGIVYYPNNPYLICIMTQGTDFTKLEQVIQSISKMVYEEVDSRRIMPLHPQE